MKTALRVLGLILIVPLVFLAIIVLVIDKKIRDEKEEN